MQLQSHTLKKAALLGLILMLLLSSLQLGVGKAAAAAVPDGTYPVDYFYMHAASNTVSVANDYLKSAGQKGSLVVQNGEVFFEHEVKPVEYGYFMYLGARLDGKPKATITTNPATQREEAAGLENYQAVAAAQPGGEGSNYLVRYKLAGVAELHDLIMHINIPVLGYIHWYHVRLKLDLSSLPGQSGGEEEPSPGGGTVTQATYEQVKTLISVSRSVYEAAREGTEYGDYSPGSKSIIWSGITQAEYMLSMTEDGNETAYGQIYNALNGSLAFFQTAQKLADRTLLISGVNAVKSFLKTASKQGTAAGSPGSAVAPIQEGEYEGTRIDSLQSELTRAQGILDKGSSTPEQISGAVTTLESAYQAVLPGQFVQARPFKLYALDTLEPTDKLSQYADELEATAATLAKKSDLTDMMESRFNLTLNVTPSGPIVQAYPGLEPIYQLTLPVGFVPEQSTDTKKVYQMMPVSVVTPVDSTWLGVSMIRYSVGNVTRDVYLSFNADMLEELKLTVTGAQRLHNTALAGSLDAAAYANAKAALQTAIDTAQPVADNLAARRPAIRAAQAALQTAVDTFKASGIVEGPAAGGEQLPDGEYAIPFNIYKKGSNDASVMYDYIVKDSGKLTVQGGQKVVSFTLKQNAEILSFKTERSGALVETDKVSEDLAANTRVVSFPVSDLKARLNGWVKIYWLLPPPIGLYDHEYEVQLGFGEPVIPNQPEQRELNFSVLHGTKDQLSSMNNYFLKPGVYSDVNGKKRITLTLKDSTIIPSFKVEQNGVLTETTVISTDTAANTRVVQFETADLATLLNGQVHISTVANGQPYEMDHAIRLKLYEADKAVLAALIASAQGKHDAAVEGTEVGQYPAGAKAALQTAIDAAKAANTSVSASQQTVDAAVGALQQAVSRFAASSRLEEASYKVELPDTIKSADGTPISSYVSGGAKLEISAGKQVAKFGLASGVTLKKVEKRKADGTLEDVAIQPQLAFKQAGLVTILSTAGTTISFEVDRTADYVLTLIGADSQEKAFEIPFAQLTVTKEGGNPGGNPGPGPGTGNPGPVNIHGISDGTYSIAYKVVKYGTINDTSVMQDYVITPGKLIVENGTMRFQMTLKQSKEVTDFQIDNGSGLSTPTTVEEDEKANTRTVQFQIGNLDTKLKGWVKVYWQVTPDFLYDHQYDIHLTLDRSSLKRLDPGQNPGEVDAKPFVQAYTPGDYSLDFAVNLRGTSRKSVTSDYIKQPAKLVVKDGKSYMQVTVSHKEVTGLKIETDGVLTDAEVISTNEERNERTVRFEVKDTKSKVFAQLVMAVPGKYNGEYEVEFILDGTSIKPYKEQADGQGQAGVQPGSKPGIVLASSFADVENHWAKAVVERAVGLGLANGYEDGTFRPDDVVTRAEFAALLSRTLKLEESAEELSFADTADIPDWVKPYLSAVAKAGLIGGYEDGTFRPGRRISRAELGVIVSRALELELDAMAGPSFADTDSIPAWALREVAAAHERGIINGRDNNLFAPNESATRAEAVTLMLALFNEVK
ncbi:MULTISPECIES: NEAT domain-containing protein [unclassified Paenibacillus]|uniref:NEAT domain-containing protein n=1 Tax=unclassified Paenibacillus TaxID=185978 RepID=UPI000930A19F|nr:MULTISPECIES: NEAT domain-containing protein [unclassified Paenibacillus]